MRRQALKRLGRRQPPQQQLLLLRSSNPRHGVAPQLPGATAAAFGALVVAALVLGAAVAAPLPAAAATAAGPATAAAAAGGPQCASPCFTVADYVSASPRRIACVTACCVCGVGVCLHVGRPTCVSLTPGWWGDGCGMHRLDAHLLATRKPMTTYAHYVHAS